MFSTLIFSLMMVVCLSKMFLDGERWSIQINNISFVKPTLYMSDTQSKPEKKQSVRKIVTKPSKSKKPKQQNNNKDDNDSSSSSQNIKDEIVHPTLSPKQQLNKKHPFLSKILEIFSNDQRNRDILKTTGSIE